MHRVDQIIAKHQLTTGGGNVIAYQLDNEASQTGSGVPAYMAALAAQVRADGITVPFFTNESRANVGNWLPTDASAVEQLVRASTTTRSASRARTRPRGTPARTTRTIVRNTFGQLNQPIVAAEFQGGAVSSWGGASFDNCRQLTNGQFERVYYQSRSPTGSTIKSMYMFFGGTSWGWQPSGYTSYDYGAPITEGRQLPDKYQAAKQLGVHGPEPPAADQDRPDPGHRPDRHDRDQRLAAPRPRCTNGPGGAALTNCGAINVTHRSNPDDGSAVLLRAPRRPPLDGRLDLQAADHDARRQLLDPPGGHGRAQRARR